MTSGELFPEPHEPTDRQVIAELEREIAKRKSVYPAWINEGRLQQRVAEHRIRCLEIALELYSRVTRVAPTRGGTAP